LAGAGIAGASYMRTSISAFKLAIAGFIIPFLVVFNPAVILEPENWVWAVGSAVAIPVGLTALTAAIYNCGLTPFTRTERLMAALTAVMMSGYAVFRHIDELPLEYPMLALGTVLALVLLRSQLASRRRRTTPAGQPASAAAR
ncbi:MAG: hypothetical protein KDJ41_05600, partial [Hyphomicrobiaceae bacterium]|nr:hypothetical protein [Hyphomicrobiaceae bacterium]